MSGRESIMPAGARQKVRLYLDTVACQGDVGDGICAEALQLFDTRCSHWP